MNRRFHNVESEPRPTPVEPESDDDDMPELEVPKLEVANRVRAHGMVHGPIDPGTPTLENVMQDVLQRIQPDDDDDMPELEDAPPTPTTTTGKHEQESRVQQDLVYLKDTYGIDAEPTDMVMMIAPRRGQPAPRPSEAHPEYTIHFGHDVTWIQDGDEERLSYDAEYTPPRVSVLEQSAVIMERIVTTAAYGTPRNIPPVVQATILAHGEGRLSEMETKAPTGTENSMDTVD